jgi:hypothetical protein
MTQAGQLSAASPPTQFTLDAGPSSRERARVCTGSRAHTPVERRGRPRCRVPRTPLPTVRQRAPRKAATVVQRSVSQTCHSSIAAKT